MHCETSELRNSSEHPWNFPEIFGNRQIIFRNWHCRIKISHLRLRKSWQVYRCALRASHIHSPWTSAEQIKRCRRSYKVFYHWFNMLWENSRTNYRNNDPSFDNNAAVTFWEPMKFREPDESCDTGEQIGYFRSEVLCIQVTEKKQLSLPLNLIWLELEISIVW